MRNTIKILSFALLILAQSCTSTEQNTTQTAVDSTSLNEQERVANRGGTYSFGTNIEKEAVGTIKIYPLTSDTALFFLDVNRGAPSYNMGQLYGKMSIKDNIGSYPPAIADQSTECVLQFTFEEGAVKVTTMGVGDCGFGANVKADQTYKLSDATIPKFYISGEGDTVLFKR
ncbi:MAG: hypothetical protein EOO90_20360 [Pedobacter sp.]|nr:MAG: hypothetical protein EOO90_20360 [Pedobacter sp.]